MLSDKTLYLNFWQSYSGGHWFNYFISKHRGFSNNFIKYVHEEDHTHIKSSALNLKDLNIEKEQFGNLSKRKICMGSVQHNPEIREPERKNLIRLVETYDVKVFHCQKIVKGGRFDIMESKWPDIERPMSESYTDWWMEHFPDLVTFDVNKIVQYDEKEYAKLCDFIEEDPLPYDVINYEIENYKEILKWR